VRAGGNIPANRWQAGKNGLIYAWRRAMVKTVTLSLEEYEALVDKNGVKDAEIKELDGLVGKVVFYRNSESWSGFFNNIIYECNLGEVVYTGPDEALSILTNKIDSLNKEVKSLSESNYTLKTRSLIQRILNKS
jgi:hypothetical protein